MLLRQHFVRVDAQLPCIMTVPPVRTPAFRLLRHHQVDVSGGVAAAANAQSQQTTERPAETIDDVTADSGPQTLQDAQHHAPELAAPAFAAAEPASEWSIPPHAWGSHPTLLSGCERDSAPLRVAVLLSGGVDSSVALRLAQAAGHRVTAFYLQIWFQDDFRNFWDSCPWEEDLSFCRQVCEQAGVPLQVVPLTEAYWERVVSHSITEIKAGRTPNPDIMCNSRVKFGAFLEHLETAHAGCFDRIASGHYAGVSRTENGQATLRMTADALKDQTYFLAHLTQAQLARVMFPLAPLTKGGVRALAAAAGLPTQARRDSQGICFLGKVHHSEFVREHLGVWPGPLIEEDTGAVLGYHQGFWFHTIGQRKGVPLSGGPWYVVRKDITMNAVYISRLYHAAGHRRNAFRCGPFNWLSGQRPSVAQLQQCKVRHGPDLYRCRLQFEDSSSQAAGSHASKGMGTEHTAGSSPVVHAAHGTAGVSGSNSPALGTMGSSAVQKRSQHPASSVAKHQRSDAVMDPVTAVVALDGQDQGVAPGQYAVFYDGDVCLGSAVIQEAIDLHDAALLRCM